MGVLAGLTKGERVLFGYDGKDTLAMVNAGDGEYLLFSKGRC